MFHIKEVIMDNMNRMVLLIDADNTQLGKLESVIHEVSSYGRIVVKRAYGNWKKETLKNWENELKRLAIKAEQQFDYVAGKNATDMALVIDAVHLLNRNLYDGFIIVASDSDYTPLAINLHESGVFVIGVGEKKTPESFRNSCDEFVFLENIGNDLEKDVQTNSESAEPLETKGDTDSIDDIHKLLSLASEKYQDDDGFANISAAGAFIKRIKPDFDVRTFGYYKLPELLNDFPDKYEIKKYPGKGTVQIIAYKCKKSL